MEIPSNSKLSSQIFSIKGTELGKGKWSERNNGPQEMSRAMCRHLLASPFYGKMQHLWQRIPQGR